MAKPGPRVIARRPPEIQGDIVRILLTRGMVAVLDLEDADLGRFNWHANGDPGKEYAARKERLHGLGQITIWLHREVALRAGYEIDGLDVDHRDGDRLNCRRSNLRPATRVQNVANSGARSSNKSGFKGVCWHKQHKRWYAQIMADGKNRFLGLFSDPAEAAAAYANAAGKYFGEFSNSSVRWEPRL